MERHLRLVSGGIRESMVEALQDLNIDVTGDDVAEAVARTKQELGVRAQQSEQMQTIMGGWDIDVTDDEAKFLHAAVTLLKEGSVDRTVRDLEYLELDPIVDVDPDKVREVAVELNSMMRQEQEYWKRKGVTGVTLYRGIRVRDEGRVTELRAKEGETIAINELPASSWSIYPQKAGAFGNVLVAQEVPIERVVSSFFSGVPSSAEGEFIVYTPDEGAEVQLVYATR